MSDLKDAASVTKKGAGCLFTNFEDVRVNIYRNIFLLDPKFMFFNFDKFEVFFKVFKSKTFVRLIGLFDYSLIKVSFN